MQISKEEILHIARLADLNLKEDEVDTYMLHLQDILSYANVVSKAPIEGLEETTFVNEDYNVFRKDEIKESYEREILLQNAPEEQQGMFKIPKVIN